MKLLKLPYGTVEAGRKLATVFADWLFQSAGFLRVKLLSHFYLHEKFLGLETEIIVDNLLVAEKKKTIADFFGSRKN